MAHPYKGKACGGAATAAKRYAGGGGIDPISGGRSRNPNNKQAPEIPGASPAAYKVDTGPMQGPKEPTPEGRLVYDLFGGSIPRGSPLNRPLRKR